jgi:hypothetical protein
MCVIYTCKTSWPSDEALADGATTNTDGAGIAWLDKNKTGDKVVAWQKGLKDDKAIKKLIEAEKIPLPGIIHFRTSSSGHKCKELTHPFPICKGAPTWVAGTANDVLFHNGHFVDWEEQALLAGLKSKDKFPEGPWSDTRAFVWMLYLKGPGIIPFLLKGNRLAILTASPESLGTDAYSPLDHIQEFGTFYKKEGWSQSVETGFWRNKGGMSTGASRTLYTPVPSHLPGFVWTVPELEGVLCAIEKEQLDARADAGL